MGKMFPELKSSPVITRYNGGMPVLSKEDIPYEAECIFNAGVAKFQGKYVMLFRNDYRFDGIGAFQKCSIGIAFSEDGIQWKVQEKPFLTIDDQVALMRSRGLVVDDETKRILLREGYYSVVNGYKAPFLDKEATKEAGDDRYKEGTSFNDVYALFRFDRDLRETTFKHLVQVEATVRTVCSHTFAESHPEKDAYLVQANYCTEAEFSEFGLKNYMDNLLKLQSILYKTMTRSNNEAIMHYRKKGFVPIWVLSKALTFGTMEHFFHLMKPAEKREVCKMIAEATGRAGDNHRYFDPKEARLSLDPIVKFRNICAHDERLYCARIGHRDPAIDYAAMLERVEPFLCESDYESLLSEFLLTVVAYGKQSQLAVHILNESGVLSNIDRVAQAAVRRLESDDIADALTRVRILTQQSGGARRA